MAAEQSLTLEMARYLAGTDSYLNVITTQAIELADKQPAVTILERRMLAAVDLVKALGGGWDASALPSLEQLRSAELANPDNTQKVAQPPKSRVPANVAIRVGHPPQFDHVPLRRNLAIIQPERRSVPTVALA